MKVTVKYKPSEARANEYWFNKLKNRRESLVWECDHIFEQKTAVQNYMTFDGVEEYEEKWLECINCEQDEELTDDHDY